MATGLFTLKQQLQGLIQKAWTSVQVPTTTYAGSFNGSSQDLTVANNSAFLFGTGDFTVECFFNPASITGAAANQGLVGMWGTGSQTSWLLYYSGGTFIWYTSSTGSAQTATLTVNKAITVGTWYHVALVRYSGTTTIYINGTSAGSTSTVVNLYAATCALSIAITPAGGTPDYVNGSLSNLRIVKGVAVYTSNFAVPTSPLTNLTSTSLLTLQNATIVDNSSNAFTITNVGSVTTSANTTIFVNPSIATPAVEYLVVAGGGGGGVTNGGGGGAGGLLQGLVPVTTGSAITVTIGAGGAAIAAGTTSAGNQGFASVFGSITAGSGGKGGINGGATDTSGGSAGGAGGFGTITGGATAGQGNSGGTTGWSSAGGGGAGTVGLNAPNSNANGGNGGAGIASSINGTVTTYAGGGGGGSYRLTGGTGGVGGGGAGGTFSGSGGVSGTANTGGGGGGGSDTGSGAGSGAGGSGIVIISYPDIYSAPTFGGANSPTASTSGSGSMYLNGSSYLQYGGQSAFAFGTSAFTVEFWVYTFTVSVQTNLYDSRPASTNGYYPAIYIASDASLNFYVNNSNVIASSVSALTANTWYHIAVSKSGSSTKMFLNGTQVGSTYSDTNTYLNGANAPTVGCQGVTRGLYPLNGYISNLRVINGTGVYTSNFTPLTTPLTPVTNTQLLLGTVSPNQYLDSSTNAYTPTIVGTPTWNQASPFATGLGYKNRVYTWTGSGTVTF